MTDPTDRDPARDAWLSEALRHAPDAQATPPSALSDEILRQARAAARGEAGAPAKKPPARSTWAAAWSWLARPPVAAGFASVVVATLVGLMWWDQPIDPTLARPPARDASPAAPAAPASASVVTAAPESAAKPESQAPAARRLAEREPAAPAPSASIAQAAKPAAKRAEQETLQQSARREPLPFEGSAATVDAAPAAAEAAPQAPARENGPVPLAAPAAAPPPAAMRLREDAAPPATTGTRATDALDESRGLVAGALSRSAAAKTLSQAAAPSRENAAARPPVLGALLASVASEPERWGFQRGDAIRPMNPALQRWLARLDAATSTHWRGGTEAAPSRITGALRLYRDGTLTATLGLDEEGVWFAPVWRAALPTATAAELGQALDDATP